MEFLTKQEEIQKIINDVASDLNYLIYESSMLFRGENSRVIIKIDSLSGITHKDCNIFSRELAKRIDDKKLLPNYSMEVSSPGLKRKLRSIDEFARFKGSLVKVICESEGETKVIKGIINNIIDTKVELKSDNSVAVIDFNTIKKANLEY